MNGRFLGAAVVLLAALGAPAGYAYGATTAPSCTDGNLTAASLSGRPVSIKAGTAIVDSALLTNTTGATLSNASFILEVLPPPGVTRGTGTPQLAWRVDGGGWHGFGLNWATPSGSMADWQSQVQFFGATFAPKASHRLDIRTVFTTASPSGEYQYVLAYSADPCGMNELAMNNEFSDYAQGWTQPAPSPSTHKTTPPAPTQEPASTTPPTQTHSATASASPSATRSASPAESQSAASVSTGAATPTRSAATLDGAQAAAASKPRSTAPILEFVGLAVLLLLGGGLYAGRRVRRAKADPGDS